MKAITCVALSVSLSGCTVPLAPVTLALMAENKAYHSPSEPGQSFDQRGPNYDLGERTKLRVVEFDDMGELWDRRQLASVEQDIRRAAVGNPDGVLLVTYVHGWEHNADPADAQGNLERFKQTLLGLGHAYRSPGRKRDVVGVYLGWRGRQWKYKPGNSPLAAVRDTVTKLDFFHAKAAGKRVGGPAATHTLLTIAKAARTSPASKVVVVGHSFGGLMVEQALVPVIAAGITEPTYTPPADLILLVNQAENAINASKLITALKHSQSRVTPIGSSKGGLPLLVSVASQTDTAVRRVFPLGSRLGRYALGVTNTTTAGRTRKEADYTVPGESQKDLLFHAPAYIDALQNFSPITLTHPTPKTRLGYAEIISLNEKAEQGYDAATGQFNRLSFVTSKGTFTTRRTGGYNDTPYWIIQMTPEFLDGHSGFWGNDKSQAGARGSEEVVALVTVLTNLDRPIVGAARGNSPVKVMSAR
jgi:hypothetical protein